jgi:hypothetical protein
MTHPWWPGVGATLRIVNGPVVAPIDMALPTYVRRRLGRRQGYVLDHGFDGKIVGADWWNERLHAEGLDQRVQLCDHGQTKLLTRHDLFEIARPVARPNATDIDVLTLLWHVLAWGTGQSQRGNNTRIRAFVCAPDRQRNVGLLKNAIAYARDGDAASAYQTLIRRGGGQIRGLGPAFFTKLLYFASEGIEDDRCLILDARVAGSLSRAGWSSLPWSTRSEFSYNWYTVTYASYCKLLGQWAAEETDRQGAEVWPDEIERALFEGEASR